MELASDTLYVLPSVKGHETNLGLYEGTLFDVLDINNGTGNTTTKATGFDLTCGYLTDLDQQFTFHGHEGTWNGNWVSGAINSTVGFYNTRQSIGSYGHHFNLAQNLECWGQHRQTLTSNLSCSTVQSPSLTPTVFVAPWSSYSHQ